MLAAVDALEPELVELLQALIRIPTVNPPGEAYEDFVAAFRARLDHYGYTTEVHSVPEEDLAELAPFGEGLPRASVIATMNYGDGPVVHLNGHYDVVPVGSDWTREPFGGELADGWIYGRGAADMKSGLAAQVIAAEAVRRVGFSGTIVQSAVPDEETVGVRNAGMGWLVEQGLIAGRRADHHRAVRPGRRRHRPQGRDLGRDHAARQAGARLLAAARRQRGRGDGALPVRDRPARPPVARRAHDDLRGHARRAALDALLRHDPRRRRDQHRARPLHGQLQPPARRPARIWTRRARSCWRR